MTPQEDDGPLQEYLHLLPSVILDCQFIEEGLKLYISCCYKIINAEVEEYFPFQLSGSDIDKEPLGRLIDKFSKLTTNSDLVARLRKVTTARNKVAHRGFLLTQEEQKDSRHIGKLITALKSLKTETRGLVMAVLNEWDVLEKKRRESQHASNL